MDIELFVHGTATGQTFWNTSQSEVSLYYQNFTTIDGSILLIEQKPFEGKPYIYYNYLLYDNHTSKIISTDGRLGSNYIGITLRTDKILTDFLGIYYLLDNVFKKRIVGTVLSSDGANYKFKVANINDCNEELQEIFDDVVYIINNGKSIITSTTTEEIKEVKIKGAKTQIINIFETTNQYCLNQLKKGEKLVLSPFAPSMRERNLQNKNKQDKEALQAQIQEAQKKLSKNEENKNSLESQLATLKKEKDDLNKKIENLNTELQKYKKSEKANIAKDVAEIKSDVKRLLACPYSSGDNKKPKVRVTVQEDEWKGKENQVTESKDDNLGLLNLITYIFILIIVIGFFVLIFFLFKGCFSKEEPTFPHKDSIETIIEQNETEYEESNEKPTIEDKGNNISIHDYNNEGYIEPGRNYQISARKNAEVQNWKINGGKITTGKENSPSITIQLDGSSTIDIYCTINDTVYHRGPIQVTKKQVSQDHFYY
ncbi:MAG: hypothetical protein IKO20_03445 [Bacteroidaceae bacterium]|nr:hypothetical protein [Bacteroidaceae bacterium]